MEVRITVHNDQATISLASANPEVREALQQALPRLDSLLNSLGIELAESEITDRQQRSFNGETREVSQGLGDGADDAADTTARVTVGLIDAWV